MTGEPIGGRISRGARAKARARRTPILALIGLATAAAGAAPAAAQPADSGEGEAAFPTWPDAELGADLGDALSGPAAPAGLSAEARNELADAGVDRYLGAFAPVASHDAGGGWTRHTFDPADGDGPVCISGTPYSVLTRAGNPTKLLVFAKGGGACWQGFYHCRIHAEDQAPASGHGVFDLASEDNPFAEHSIVVLPYCDGSFFSGDSRVPDPDFPYGGVRHHRGLRNQSAGLDLAASLFPDAQEVTLAGASAGGVGVAGFTPFLARFLYGDDVDLSVFNDAGPVAQSPDQAALLDVRAADWEIERLFPESCGDCDARDPSAALVHWRLERDATIREAFYATDADVLNRLFLSLGGGSLMTQAAHRDLLLAEHGALHDAHPLRYKRFIVSGDRSHGALQEDRFYTQEANDVPLHLWTEFFLIVPDLTPDLVEDYAPAE